MRFHVCIVDIDLICVHRIYLYTIYTNNNTYTCLGDEYTPSLHSYKLGKGLFLNMVTEHLLQVAWEDFGSLHLRDPCILMYDT